MKIFYKKDYLKVSGELEELNKTLEFYRKYTEELDNDNEKIKKKLRIVNGSIGGFTKKINKLNNEIVDKSIKIKDLEDNLKSANTSKGGLTKQINSLKEEIKALTAQIKEKNELLSKRYIVKKISSGRTPNTLKTNIKSSANESRAIKYVKERL